MALEVAGLWKDLVSSKFANIDDKFLDDFRMPGSPSQRTNAWDPFEKSTRYYKFLLFNVANFQSSLFFDLYNKLENTTVGRPPVVRVKGLDITIDYLMATEEFLFLRDAIPVDALRHITEIGAGFGRTCHALTTYLPDLESYTIVDLPEMLTLSETYLRRVAPQLVHKVRFVDWQDKAGWADRPADLVININSFQEMPEATIRAYLDYADRNSTHLYVKNPICKYDPAVMGLDIAKTQLHDAFSLGLCRSVADIYDDANLERCRPLYEAAYQPSERWRLVRSEPQSIFAHVQHVAYARYR